MTGNKFEKIVDHISKHCNDTLKVKAKEYADSDRMHNFKLAAELQSCTPEQALLGMMTKHVVSIYDMVNAEEKFDEEVWDEKIGDNINYLILLRALVVDTNRCRENVDKIGDFLKTVRQFPKPPFCSHPNVDSPTFRCETYLKCNFICDSSCKYFDQKVIMTLCKNPDAVSQDFICKKKCNSDCEFFATTNTVERIQELHTLIGDD